MESYLQSSNSRPGRGLSVGTPIWLTMGLVTKQSGPECSGAVGGSACGVHEAAVSGGSGEDCSEVILEPSSAQLGAWCEGKSHEERKLGSTGQTVAPSVLLGLYPDSAEATGKRDARGAV